MSKDTLLIRRFQKEDTRDIISLWKTVFKNDPPWNDPAEIIQRKQAFQTELFLVGLFHDKVIATVLGGYDGFRGWIYHLAVQPKYRNKGFASLMLKQIESDLTALGCIKINIQIRSTNTDVIEFYKSAGFLIENHTSMGKLIKTIMN